MKFSKIFWGEGTATSPDLTPYPFAPYSKFLDPPLLLNTGSTQENKIKDTCKDAKLIFFLNTKVLSIVNF